MEKLKKITISLFLVSFLVVFMCSGLAVAKTEYPEKPITIFVGYNAGGSTDIFARILASYLEPIFGQPCVIVNKPGGGGGVAEAELKGVKPDGYTVLVGGGALLVLKGLGNVEYGYQDFDNIARIIKEDVAICVKADSPWDSIEDLVNYAKKNPGELKVGFAGVGSYTWLCGNRFLKETRIEANGIGFGGGAKSLAALLGGFVDVIFQHPAEVYSQWKAGKVKMLAIMGETRNPMINEIPTLKESGINVVGVQWRGVHAPKGIPEEVKTVWYKALDKIQKNPEFREKVEDTLMCSISFIKGDEFNNWLKSEAEWIYPLIENLNLK